MVTVLEILYLAIETDMQRLAHRVFWAVSECKVCANEDSKILDTIDYDEVAISKMIEQNVLEIGKVKLFVAATTKPEEFAFYYSENILEAHALHQELFKVAPKRLTDAPHLLGKVFQLIEMKAAEILYFHRKKVVAYPYYLGHAIAGERSLDKRAVTY
ncbi:hypothetical protein [Sporosarcina sp. G11-34]|uniref:hypothetical protein n=1 Tax=Sporosarcina sp. G11-34 TaxID=2849605 RepID=UPI0022A9AFEE|nr:hypothetical protein [Sporosarcina sp. G11-34]MCZ2260789.1 hypothetical protein [Sporosarcina sp. G11-34]